MALRWRHLSKSLKRVEQCFYLYSSRYFTLTGNRAREFLLLSPVFAVFNLIDSQEIFWVPPGCSLVNQTGKAKTSGPHISNLPSKYGNALRQGFGNTTCLGYGRAEFHVDSKPLPSSLVPDLPTESPLDSAIASDF